MRHFTFCVVLLLASTAFAQSAYTVTDLRKDYHEIAQLGTDVHKHSIAISHIISGTLARGGQPDLKMAPQQLQHIHDSLIDDPSSIPFIYDYAGPPQHIVAPQFPLDKAVFTFNYLCTQMANNIIAGTRGGNTELIPRFTRLLTLSNNRGTRWHFDGVVALITSQTDAQIQEQAAELAQLLPTLRQEARENIRIINWGFNTIIAGVPGASSSFADAVEIAQKLIGSAGEQNISAITAGLPQTRGGPPPTRGLMGDIWNDVTSNWSDDYQSGSEIGATAGQVIGGTAGALAGGAAAGAMTMTTATAAGAFMGAVEGAEQGEMVGTVAGGVLGTVGGAIGTAAGWIVGTIEANLSQRGGSLTRGTTRSGTGDQPQPAIELSFE